MGTYLVRLLLVAIAGGSTVATAGTGDWPQWRGPNRDGSTSDFKVPAVWPRSLERVWRLEVGEGHASPVVRDRVVYVHSREGEDEVVRAIGVTSGLLWSDRYPAPYRVTPEAEGHGKGPFSTPLVGAERLYTYGVREILSAYDRATGKSIWRRDFADEYPMAHPYYGTSQSPLIVEGKLLVHVGGPGKGAFLALDAETGETIWSWAEDGPAYGSPIVATLGESTQMVTLTQKHVVGLDLASGELLWKYPFAVRYDNTMMTPVVDGARILVSSYQMGMRALQPLADADGWVVRELWHTREASTFMSDPVVADGVLYGFSHLNSGQYFALETRTGDLLWTSRGRAGDNASLTDVGPFLLVLDTGGQLEIVEKNPRAYLVVARYEVADEPVWAHPAVFDRFILVKDRTNLTLYRVPGTEPTEAR